MHRTQKLIIVSMVMCSGLALVVSGCERIPEHVLNSPPAKHQRNPFNPDRTEPPSSAPTDSETPRAGPTPAAPVVPPRPQDKLASASGMREIEPTPAEELTKAAGDALVRIGAPSVQTLIQELASDAPIRRRQAAETLARIGPEAVDAAESLVLRLEDPAEETTVKIACAEALKEMGPVLWPKKPAPLLGPTSLDPPAAVSAFESQGPLASAIARRETRRIEYEERRQAQYYNQLQEYERRLAIAQRAVNALSKLAIQSESS